MTQMALYLSKGCYFPGELVEGRAVLTVPKPIKVRGIALQAEGYERTSVTVSRGKHSHTYVSKNDILQYPAMLSGECELQPGEYSYPFRFGLPPDALATYKGSHAVVLYSVKVNADIPMWFDAHHTLDIPVVLPRRGIQADQRSAPFMSGTAGDPLKPGFRAVISRSFCFAGESVEGTITLTTAAGKRVRKADIRLRSLEQAVAQGHPAEAPSVINRMEIPGEQLTEGVSIPFSMRIPREARSTYQGAFSSLRWFVDINLDVALAFDVSARQEIVVVNAV